MTFASPIFFWAALSLLPLAAVYFIRTRPRRQPVNAFFLWQKVFQQSAARSLFQRLRNLLSLLLVALAFLAAVFALTRPQRHNGATPDLLIILDRSVSMRASDHGKSRLDRAKDLARSWVTAIGGNQRAAVASAASRLEYHAHLTGHLKLLDRAIEDIQPTDVALDPHALDELALLSSAAGQTQGKVRILFVTDRHSPTAKLPDGIEVVALDDQLANLGIAAADLRWETPQRAALFVTVVSDDPEARNVELELVSARDGSLARFFSMNVPSRGTTSDSVAIDNLAPGDWLLRLRHQDALPEDNVAPLGLNAPQPIPVRIAATQPYFFEQCITAFSKADSLFVPTQQAARLTLAQGSAPDSPAAIVFAPTGDAPYWSQVGEELPAGPPEVVSKDHPLLARIDPTVLSFDGARKLTAPKGAVVVLAHANGTPLLYTCTHDGRHVVVANFDPARADFFLSPWFPVLVHDASVMLTGRTNAFPSVAATGTRQELPGTDAIQQATFTAIDSAVTELPQASPAPVERIGNYDFSRNSTAWHLGGAVLSAGESGPAPAGHASAVVQLASGWPLAAWLLVAAIIAVIAEELLYHRRKVG